MRKMKKSQESLFNNLGNGESNSSSETTTSPESSYYVCVCVCVIQNSLLLVQLYTELHFDIFWTKYAVCQTHCHDAAGVGGC